MPKKEASVSDKLQQSIDVTLVKLGIDKQKLARCAPITEILHNAEGGIEGVIAAIRFSIDPTIEAFLDEYDSAADEDRQILPLEAFLIKADVDPAQFLGEAILAMQNRSANIVKIIATTSHPSVMRARVENALKPGGYRDRNAIDTALRFLPSRKDVTNIFVQGERAQSMTSVNPEDVDTDDVFPDLLKTQKLIGEGE